MRSTSNSGTRPHPDCLGSDTKKADASSASALVRRVIEGLSRNCGSQVRRAQKEGMTARVGGVEMSDEFYAVFSRCMRDLGTPVYAKAFSARS